MYESKKSSARKDTYKYQKSSYNRNFHNSTHFNHHKYTKYKQKYNYGGGSNDPDEELIFQKIFDEKNKSRRYTFKEFDEENTTPINKENKFDNKENFSMNSNMSNTKTKMRTNDENENSDKNNINNIMNNNYIRADSEEFLIEEKEEKVGQELKNEIINEINNLTNNINNININNNINNDNINFNVENVINDLLNKNNEFIFSSNEKENFHIDHKKNIYKTPQPFKANSTSSINLSSKDINEAYYVPRKLSTLYDMYGTQQPNNFFEKKHNSLNNFNFLTTIQKPTISLSNKQNNNNNLNNLGITNNINLNYFQNNKMPFNYSNNSLNNFNISPTPNIPHFTLFEPNNNINVNNIPNLSQCLNNSNNNNNHNNMNKNPFHNMMPQMELNQCILKTQINNNNLFEKDKENTDILEINVKIKENKTLTFKIRRYDDMFRTVKIFCEINKLDIKLIRPFIIYIIKALNSIYGIYNLKLKKDEIEFLQQLKNQFNDDNSEKNDSDLNADNEDNEDEDDNEEEEEYENEFGNFED